MYTLITAFLSLLFLLSVGIQAVITGDSFLTIVTALGSWWALSAIVREVL